MVDFQTGLQSTILLISELVLEVLSGLFSFINFQGFIRKRNFMQGSYGKIG